MNYLTEEKLKALPTSRLLNLYKSIRSLVYAQNGYHSIWYDECWDGELNKRNQEYRDLIKSILDTREHVKRK